MAKSLKTMFVRVSAHNETQDGQVVDYTFDDIQKILMDWERSSQSITYYAIEHNGEPGDENKHFHIVGNFNGNAYPFEAIKKHFPYGKIESARNMRRAVQYLIHLNDHSKTPYSWDDVFTNGDLTKYQTLTPRQLDEMARITIGRIMSGELREYNFYKEVDPILFSKRKNQLKNALELFYEKVTNTKDRNIEVYVLEGSSELAKTYFAKEICRKKGLAFCVSSHKNDPMQDYKGHPAMIFDDLRDDAFSLDGMLKLLDNHTFSTTKSRYYNKSFIGDIIFITTNLPWNDWYADDTDEVSKNALKRRVTKYYKFKPSNQGGWKAIIEEYAWNRDSLKYEYVDEMLYDFSHLKPDANAETNSLFNFI